MKKRILIPMLIMTLTAFSLMGCGETMNDATNDKQQNSTIEDNGSNDSNANDDYENNTTNDNVVDGVVNGVEDTVDGVVNGVDDVVDGAGSTLDDIVTDDGTATNGTNVR